MLVPKKSGFRLVTDYRKLNKVSDYVQTPTPTFEAIMDFVSTQNPVYYSVCDLLSAFFQMKVTERSRDYTGIITPDYRVYRFKRLPFGLKSSPGAFQLLLRSVIGDLENIIVAVYMDDLLFCSSTFEGLLKDMQIVFDRLIKAGLTLQISKCELQSKKSNI